MRGAALGATFRRLPVAGRRPYPYACVRRSQAGGVAEYLKPIGFWSYTSSDDTASGGRLSQLRLLLADALQLRIGRNPKVHIFQDVATIPHGTDWLQQIRKALGESSFLIPILTPAFLQSEMCCEEVMHFREREAALGRDDLIFPLHYIDVEDIDPHDPGECHDARVLTLLRSRQAIDFRALRLRDPASEAVAVRVDEFAVSLRRALRRQNGTGTGSGAPAEAPPVQPAAHTVAAAPAAASSAPSTPAATIDGGGGYPEMVLIPAGDFLMGIPEEESEREGAGNYDKNARPVHRVTIARPFWLGRHPVTRGEYAAFAAETNRTMPSKAWTFEPDAKGEWQYQERDGRGWRNPGYEQTDHHPVVCVSHTDATAYAAWLSARTGYEYRLPSEAEWEYAARAGTGTARFWGDGRDGACRYANVADRSLAGRMNHTFDKERFFDCDDGFAFTAPVGAFLPNAFGLHDMLGNVWEWTADRWHAHYAGAPNDGSAWTTGGDSGRRVLRGGSWNVYPWVVRAGIRIVVGTDYRNNYVGFRLARTAV